MITQVVVHATRLEFGPKHKFQYSEFKSSRNEVVSVSCKKVKEGARMKTAALSVASV